MLVLKISDHTYRVPPKYVIPKLIVFYHIWCGRVTCELGANYNVIVRDLPKIAANDCDVTIGEEAYLRSDATCTNLPRQCYEKGSVTK